MNNLIFPPLRNSIIAISLLVASSSYSQNASEDRLLITAELGTGILFGPSNLSPWGVDYRNEYKRGFSGNVKVLNRLNKVLIAGLKYSLFAASENYELIKDAKSSRQRIP